MAGRPRKPVALKKLEGTYTKYRDEGREEAEKQLSAVLPASKIKVSKEITNPEVKKQYKSHIEMLKSLGGAFVQMADSPLLEYAYCCLQASKVAYEVLKQTDVLAEEYESLMKKYTKFFGEFERIGKEFLLTPQERNKLKLDVLTAAEKQLNIIEKKSAVASLLERKQS